MKLEENLHTFVSTDALRELAWSGVPPDMRPQCWRLLLGYAPPNSDRRQAVLARKRQEYRDCVPQYYDIPNTERSEDEVNTLRQVSRFLSRGSCQCPSPLVGWRVRPSKGFKVQSSFPYAFSRSKRLPEHSPLLLVVPSTLSPFKALPCAAVLPCSSCCIVVASCRGRFYDVTRRPVGDAVSHSLFLLLSKAVPARLLFPATSFLMQIAVDVPRTVPDVKFYQQPAIQTSLTRILYIW